MAGIFVAIQLRSCKYFIGLARTKDKKMLQFLHCFLYAIGLLTKMFGVFFLCFFLMMNIMRCLIPAFIGWNSAEQSFATEEQGVLEPARTHWVQQMHS